MLRSAAWLWAEQRRLQREPASASPRCPRGVPHGLAAWKPPLFPTPLAWGASFDPALVREVGAAIGSSMRALGIHQGLAPVLDVIRDPRWGRSTSASARTVPRRHRGDRIRAGPAGEGVHATLNTSSGTRIHGGRNHAPVHVGPREIADVFLPLRDGPRRGGAWSVMNSYVDLDGVPVASDADLLTGILRDRLGFTGVVVADYFAVAFLEVMHAVAAIEAMRLSCL